MPERSAPRANPRTDIALLAILGAFTLFALAGYATFGRHPALLAAMPAWALSFYAKSFGFFALGHVLLSMAVLAVMLTLRTGARWLPAFGALYAISLSSELAGTTWGVPFGEYSYSALLAPMWLERVPVVIPLSWFAMALPSYALSVLSVRGRVARIAVASMVLLAWDLALDPAMSYATPYWSWGEGGAYYGMPLLNLVGWYVTGIVLATALTYLRAEQWTVRVPARWWLSFYGLNLALPLGMCAAAGLWPAVLATSAVLFLLGASLTLVVRQATPRLA